MPKSNIDYLKTLEEMDNDGVTLTDEEYALLREYVGEDLPASQSFEVAF